MATPVIDTADWQVVVPLKPALNLTGSHLTATLAERFGGAVVALDSAILVPGYDGAHQIDWAADANGLTDHLLLTVTRAMRGDWLATGPNGLPGLVTLFADVKRTVAGSGRGPVPLGRTSLAVVPGTDSPAVAAAAGSFQAVLTPLPGLQTTTATALVVGPQGPSFPLPTFDPVADAGKTFGLRVVNGALVWVVLDGSGGAFVALSGAISGASLLGGSLSRIAAAALAGSLAGAGGPAGGLTIVNTSVAALAGALAGGGVLTGALGIVTPVALVGTVAASGGPSGSLGLARALAGAIAVDGLAPGTLTIAIPLAGALQSGGGPAGALGIGSAFTGAVPGAGTLAGALTVLGSTSLIGAVPAPLGLQGALTIAPGLVNARKGRLMAALPA